MNGVVGEITYKSELARKSIHLSSLLIPITYLHIPHTTGITILVAMTAVSWLIDVLRHFHEPSRTVLMKVFGKLLRKHETVNGSFALTGATWVLIAATLTLGVFPTIVGVSAFTVLIVSDTFAALIGRRIRSRPFLDKSIAGTLTFVGTAWCVVVFFTIFYALPWTYVVAGSIGAAAAAIAEAASVRMRLDDNIAIPFSMAITMMLADRVLQFCGQQSILTLLP